MNTHNIKTSHELADMLEGVAKASREFANTLEGVANVLREPPELQLTEPGQTLDVPDVPKNVQQKDNKQSAQFPLADLANRLPTLEKADAEAELKTLKVDSLRQLASLLGIRMPSKATKSESINMLLSQVFDIPAGQELIRTFHKRNPSPPRLENGAVRRGKP